MNFLSQLLTYLSFQMSSQVLSNPVFKEEKEKNPKRQQNNAPLATDFTRQ